ncbi:MAG: phosphatidate cytidylyltransferase [Clostridiales Family XIII bacterium]|jgi:phosphatidate cytidylyltransferase|nr:phosphatidate cytidylyltransferase [Clostridiales Family XIII bacterium]
MKTRAISALIMAPMLIIVFLGGYFLIAGVLMLTILALREFADAFGEKRPAMWVFWASIAILYAGYLVPAIHSYIMLPWSFISLLLCFLSMFAIEKRDLVQGMTTITGVFYVIFLAFHIVMVDAFFSTPIEFTKHISMTGLHSYVWIVVLAAFGTDIFAFFTGVLIGSRKLCPAISPKKTVEGAIGGVLGSVLLCGLFGYLFIKSGFADCVALGVIGGVVSQLGDLSASAMKRKIGIKDWSSLIPGHGGVLDRIDSILFTAPTVFYYLMLKAAFVAAAA